MKASFLLQRLLSTLTVLSLLASPLSNVFPPGAALAQAGVAERPAAPPDRASQPASDLPAAYLPFLAPADARPLLRAIPTDLPTLYGIAAETEQALGPYRTTVKIRGVADLARLKKAGATILNATKNTATIVVDRLQLEQLAKLRFSPRGTELTAKLVARGGGQLPATATSLDILAATVPDADLDGLTDTEESWWCTDPNNADSDNDKVSDGAEVQALIDWVDHVTTVRPASGKPFAGWPPDHAGCYDSDYDSVPDAVETYVFGLNPSRESTARDKYDDGQKLFGITNCPGSGGGCGYGALPRSVDWGVIFAEMPSWVKAPYDSPFVAAFPEPDVEVVDNSIVITAKTTIQTDHTIQNGEAHTYGTSETRGTSTSVANTTTWNNWQEVSEATPKTSKISSLKRSFQRSTSSSSGADELKNHTYQYWIELGIGAGTLVLCGLLSEGLCVFEAAAIGLGAVGATGKYAIDVSGDINKLRQDAVIPESDNACHVPQQMVSQPYCSVSDTKPVTASDIIKNQVPLAPKQDRGVIEGTQYSINDQSQLTSQRFYNPGYPVTQVPVTTVTNGKSWGGAQTVTNSQFEEHTISQASTKEFSESWSNATALDTTHAADLVFSYNVSNKGSDYAREIDTIAFNIYIGDDPNPVCTYFVGSSICGISTGSITFNNIMPGEVHSYTSSPIPLTLAQMQAIDLGAPIFIVVEDFTYGVDELFYQDAINSGVTFVVDSGDSILHSYVLPTWGSETIQDVTERFFPVTEDTDGNLLSLSVPDYSTSSATWSLHSLGDNAWWNVYLNNLGTSGTPYKDTLAAADSGVLIRMNLDSDRDGYSDRTELAAGTNPADPSSHPSPQLVAAAHSVRAVNTVTTTLAFLNVGNYDAYGVEAHIYAPDASTTIVNNTIGGGGRVLASSQVVLGSQISAPSLANWHGGAQPYSAGSYSGNVDKTFTFTAANPGNIGGGTLSINWDDGVGNTGVLAIGTGYNAPLPLAVRDGVQIGFGTGTVNAGDMFTLTAQLPGDTFIYSVSPTATNVITPVIVISYNDPQGKHEFVTPVEVSDLGVDLSPYASQMQQGVRLDIATIAIFTSGISNTTYLIANSSDSKSITNGHLFADFIDDTGNLVLEQAYTTTFQSGPNIVPVIFNTFAFSQTYQTDHDYTLLAFWTDSQGNIIDSHARLFSTFAADPTPILSTAPGSWDFGTVTQGATPQQVVSLVNTGLLPLNAVVSSSDPNLTLSGASGILSVAPAGTYNVTAALNTTAISGTVALSLTIRSNDPAHQTTVVLVTGTVLAPTAQATAFDIVNRPWDKTVQVYGNVSQYSVVTFTESITPDVASMEPCKVFAADRTTLKGVGKYCSDFGTSTLPYQVFGDGRDGSLIVPTGAISYVNNVSATLVVSATAGQSTIMLTAVSGFSLGDQVLIAQPSAGTYEVATIAGIQSNSLTLTQPLQKSYPQDLACPGGFTGQYFSNGSWSGSPLYTQCDLAINFDWGGGAPAGLPSDNFSIRWTSTIYFPAGTYSFYQISDDDAYLYVDGVQRAHSASGDTLGIGTDVTLSEGNHAIRVDYNENGGNAWVQLYFNRPGITQVIRLPQYHDVTVQNGGTLTTPAWNGSSGGILAFVANGTVTVNGSVIATGAGYRAGAGTDGSSHPANLNQAGNEYNLGAKGEGTGGPSIRTRIAGDGANGTGGGGGCQGNNGGGGGGNGTSVAHGCGQPGNVAGNASLSNASFGGGGGGGGQDWPGGAGGGQGGNGGGFMFVVGRAITVSGSIAANGTSGNNFFCSNCGAAAGGGGGGAGGSILLRGQNVALDSNVIIATGGVGGSGQNPPSANGGAGGDGRIAVEYQNLLTPITTTPSANTTQTVFYIAEKPDSSNVRLTVPDIITGGQNYVMQFGRRFAFGVGGGAWLTPTQVLSTTYAAATMDALVTNLGAGGTTTMTVSVGNQPIYTTTQTLTQPTTIALPNFVGALNAYLTAQPYSTTVNVPMTVTINRQADVILTNLILTGTPGIDLAVASSDLALGCPGAAACQATEGNSIPISVTIHNTGPSDASSAVVSYYAGNPNVGGQLLGSSYVATVAANGGTALATFQWNTEGFTHTQTLYAVVDPPNAIGELNEANNVVSATLDIKTKPDLHLASLAWSATDRVVGEPITATLVLSNGGETDALSNTLRALVTGERVFTATADLPTGVVPATSTITLTTVFTPATFGTHTITVTADVSNTVTEFNESNNVLTATVYAGLPATDIQAGDAGDTAYNSGAGFGYLNGDSYDFCGCGDQNKTVRYDGFGNLQYRFDGLQAGRFYHFDATFYQEGDNFTQLVLFNGFDTGVRVPMNSGIANGVSLLVPREAYTTSTVLTVTIQRAPGAPAAQTRFLAAGSNGPSFASELSLIPIEYTYIDAGGAGDAPYDAARGYGYLNGFASGGSTVTETYRTAFTGTVYYRFDRLNPQNNYVLNLTLYDNPSSTKQESILADGVTICGPYTLNSLLRPRCVIPASVYADGSVTVAISSTSGVGPLVNEIALEQQSPVVANLALGQPATQSSTFGGGEAGRAVDGNTDGNFANGSVTSTGPDAQAWWQVDLGAPQAIGSISVWNRSDCCAERLAGFYVFASALPFASTNLSATLAQTGVYSAYVTSTGGRPTSLALPANFSGQYVRVQLAGTNYLSLAEAQVWAAGGANITSFSAVRTPAAVNVQWTAQGEANLKSYDLYRSSDNAVWSLVAQTPAASNCQPQGAGRTYSVVDGGASAGQLYAYKLVLNGDQCHARHSSVLNQVVAPAVANPYQLWLPLVER